MWDFAIKHISGIDITLFGISCVIAYKEFFDSDEGNWNLMKKVLYKLVFVAWCIVELISILGHQKIEDTCNQSQANKDAMIDSLSNGIDSLKFSITNFQNQFQSDLQFYATRSDSAQNQILEATKENKSEEKPLIIAFGNKFLKQDSNYVFEVYARTLDNQRAENVNWRWVVMSSSKIDDRGWRNPSNTEISKDLQRALRLKIDSPISDTISLLLKIKYTNTNKEYRPVLRYHYFVLKKHLGKQRELSPDEAKRMDKILELQGVPITSTTISYTELISY